MARLRRARGLCQRAVAGAISTRTVPHLEFVHDAGIEGAINMNRLLADFSEKSDGCVLDDLPAMNENTSPVDMLIVAEILRSSLMAFLTPVERQERERLFGFHVDES